MSDDPAGGYAISRSPTPANVEPGRQVKWIIRKLSNVRLGQHEPCDSLRWHGKSTSVSGPAGPAVGSSESGHEESNRGSCPVSPFATHATRLPLHERRFRDVRDESALPPIPERLRRRLCLER